MTQTNSTEAKDSAAENGVAVRSSKWVCGWLVRGDYDREGYWITDKAGYRNTLSLTYTIITDTAGQKARRITAWRFMLEWAYPQNDKLTNRPSK